MTIKGGAFYGSKAEALIAMEYELGEKLYKLHTYSSDIMNYYMTLSGIPVSVRKIMKSGEVFIKRIRIRNGKLGNYFRVQVSAGREKQLSVSECINLIRGIDERHYLKTYPQGTDESIYSYNFMSISRYLSWCFSLDVADAEDIAQDMYLHVVYELGRKDHILETWIWYSKQRAKDFLFRRQHQTIMNEAIDIVWDGKDHDSLPFCIIRNRITRTVFILRLMGYKTREIAVLMGISKGNVESRLSRGINELKKYMKI